MTTPKLNELAPPMPPAEGAGAPAGWAFDLDPATQTAKLLGVLVPGDSLNPARDAYAGLCALNARLKDAPDEEVLEALTRQAALLESLWLYYTRQALKATRPDHAALLQSTALKCQKAHLGVLGAIRQLSEDKRNAEAIEAD